MPDFFSSAILLLKEPWFVSALNAQVDLQ